MNFLKYRVFFVAASVIAGIILYGYMIGFHGGFARSITFNGGIRLTLQLPAGVSRADLDAAVAKAGYGDAQVRLANLRLNQYDIELGPEIRDELERKVKEQEKQGNGSQSLGKTAVTEVEGKILPLLGLNDDAVVSRENIAASYGQDLTERAFFSMFWTVVAVSIYLTFRFHFSFSLGAALALFHDVILTIGFIGAFQIEPSIPVVAAVLTLIGFSINDTIVVFDRIRSTVDDKSQYSSTSVMDHAITMTLSRTVVTSVLVFMSVLAILNGGATALRDFALVLLFGVVTGTYSSIFIASTFVQFYEEFRASRR